MIRVLVALGGLAGVLGMVACDRGGDGHEHGDDDEHVYGHEDEGGRGVLETSGRVTKVELEEGRVTIDHAAVGDMPAMTMPFYAGDPEMLDGLAPGDAVTFRFRPPSEGARYELTAIEPASRAE